MAFPLTSGSLTASGGVNVRTSGGGSATRLTITTTRTWTIIQPAVFPAQQYTSPGTTFRPLPPPPTTGQLWPRIHQT